MTNAKPATRRVSAKAAQPSVVDQMSEDAEQAAAPEEYPPGTPDFLVPLAIKPRSRRAEFKRRYAVVIEKYEAVSNFKSVLESKEKPPPAEQMRIMAELDEVFQAIDDVLRLAAVDEAAYSLWSDSLENDDVLMTIFNTYQKRSQPGEASSSTS